MHQSSHLHSSTWAQSLHLHQDQEEEIRDQLLAKSPEGSLHRRHPRDDRHDVRRVSQLQGVDLCHRAVGRPVR